MKPQLDPVKEIQIIDYNNVIHKIKRYDEKSLLIDHEDATLINGFALRLSGDKDNGTYVEIGASHWKDGNNTYMLEKEFGWTGVGLEVQPHYVGDYNRNRVNPCLLEDATTFNFDKYFEDNDFPKQIDHLSIDTDITNLLCLINMPLSRYRFSTIVIENTDRTANNKIVDIHPIISQILSSYNYTLVGSGYSDDFWIDNTYLDLMGNQWDLLSSAFYHRDIRN